MKIKKVNVDGEEVYLKKRWTGWYVVEPLFLKDENGKIDWSTWSWKSFFNIKGFVNLFFLILILGTCYLAFKEQLTNYQLVVNNPCNFCDSCQLYASNFLRQNSYQGGNLENLNLSVFVNG